MNLPLLAVIQQGHDGLADPVVIDLDAIFVPLLRTN